MKRLLKTALALAAAGGTLILGSSALAAQPRMMAQGELLSAAPAPSAVAPSAPLYSNIGTDAGTFLLNGGVNASGTRYTSLVCNRVTLSQPGPQQITAFSVVLHNENAAAFTPTSASVLFYDDSGANGGPGVRLLNKAGIYYGGGNFATGAMPAQSPFRLNSAPAGYTAAYVPAPTASYVPRIWACAMFTGTSAQAAQLANVGVQKYANAPTSGSTEDLAFVSTLGVVTPVDNPAGTMSAGTGGANVFGWELTTLGSNTLLDSYQVKAADGTVGTAGFALNPGVGVEKNFSGYAATIAVPPVPAGKWNVSGLVLYPSCAVANYSSVQATIQLWDTFNGSAAPDVFGNTTPIASTTVDLGPFNCASATTVYQFPVRLPTPLSIGRSGTLGVTVKYSADSGAGLVDGAFMEVIQNAPTAAPLIAVGANASTGNTGWYKSASNRADLNFNGATDYVTGTRQHATLRVYADMVAPTRVVTASTSGPGTGSIFPGTGNVFEGAAVTYKLTPTAGNHVVTVTGTCGGTLLGSTFTTAPITADCTVNAVFAPGVASNGLYQSPVMNHAILNNGNGSTLNFVTGAWDDTGPSTGAWDANFWSSTGALRFFAINGLQFVVSGSNSAVLQPGDVVGSTSTFGGGGTPIAAWLAGADGYLGFKFTCNGRLANPVPGVCYGYAHLTTTGPNGFPATLVDYSYDGDGNSVTVGTVVRKLTSSIGTGSGLIDPLGAKTVTDSGTFTYTLYPNAGFHAGTIGGTCPAGTLTGNTYVTGAITADCTVIANFAPDLVAPTIAKAFAPASVAVNVNSVATITLTNPNASAITLSADLVDSLPTGLVVSGTATTTCGGAGVISNTTTSVKLASGATIPASGSCTITASMQSATAGSYVNTIAAGALQTSAGNNAAAASATLTVTAVVLNPPTIAKAFAPASVAVNVNSVATITLTNPNTSAITLSADLVDTVPGALVVSAATTTCTGGTASFTAGSFKLAAGATIPASGSCKLTGTMQSATVGSYVNTIAAGALQTNAGNNAAAASATLTITAAAFPAPYCNRAFADGKEPITRVKISNINNTSPAPTAGALALENFTAIIGQLAPGGTYAIATEGNSDGNFPNVYRVYFDWNHDNVFTEGPNERYEIGTITNSTGLDGQQAVANVLVPATALTGPTRMRVVKKYSTAGSACGGDDATGTSYGQAEDYTVNVDPANPMPPAIPTISKAFAPTNADVSASTTLTISLGQINATAASMTLTAALVDTFPTGMTVATVPNVSTTCPSGTVTAAAGAGSVTLSTGAKIPPAGCIVKVDVKAASAGIYVNTITGNALQTDAGNYGAAVSATYQATSPGVVNYSAGFETPDYAVGNLNGQQTWYGSVAADWKVAVTNPGTGMQHVRGTWTAAGSGTSFMLSPTLPSGTTDYSIASAKLAITVVSTGATWDFAPQDPSSGSVITRVRFLKGAGNKIQALDPSAPGAGSDGYVDTGATWTGGATYFDVKVIAKRSDSTYKVCLNNTQIYASTGFSNNIGNIAIIGNKGTGTQNNLLDVDNVVIDNINAGNCDGTGGALVAPTVAKAFSPASVVVNTNSTATITLTNPNATAITLSADLVDTLPTGLVASAAATTCGSGTASFTAGTLKLAAGATIPSGGSCTLTGTVQSATAGSYVNTIAAGALQTNAGNNAAAASATLTVTTVALNPPTVANVFVPTSVAVNTNSAATITLTNPNATAITLSADLVDTLPTGLVASAAATTCGGTASFTAGTLKLATGATIPASGSCTLTGTVQSATAGSYVNTIAAGAVQTNAGNNAAAAAATLTVTGGTGTNGIFRSPVVNHAVPATTAGTSLNLVSGVFDDTGPSGATAPFDLNFWASSGAFRYWANALYQAKFAITGTTASVMQVGDVVGPALTYSGTGTSVTPAPAWLAGADAYVGFQFKCTGRLVNPVAGVCYGYAHIKTTGPTTGMPATVVEYSYDGDGNAITIAPTGPVAPTVSKNFTPAVVVVNTDSTATITLNNANPAVATLSANLVDTLPTGLVASSATTTCGGTASFTAGAVTLGSGATIPASGSCTISATVRSATVGSYVNTIAAGALQTDKGNNAAAASATLGVTTATLNPPTIAKAFAPASVPVNTNSTATITLTNPNASAITLSADLVDTLPSGLVASAAATTCGGTASFTAGTLKLASGATIAAGASCTLTGTVQSAAVGSYVNTIAAGAVQTNAGNNAAAASATLTVTAAAFPAPYCAMTFPSNVEPITRVKFTGVDNPSSATLNGSPALENFLSVAGGTVSRGGIYSMAVEGNTDGNFTTKIKVYIDWNHNGVFDADESYVIGDLANSTGTDGKQAVADIAVPVGALVGPTRMRVTKRFSAAAVACETTGFGQGEDYTLTVDSLPPPLPNASVTPVSLALTAEQNASATGTMTVSNSGPGQLTFNINRALAELQATVADAQHASKDAAERQANDAQKAALSGEVSLPATTSLLSESKGYLPVTRAILASDPACATTVSGMISHDHGGAPDNAFGWNASAGSTTRIVDKFTPSSYPATFSTACLSLATNTGLSSAQIKIVVYADDGAGGAPGTLLGSVSATANNIASGLVEQFQAFDISSMNLSVASGSVYIGVEWDATSIAGLFLGVDTSSATSANGYQYTTAWDAIVNTRPTYRAMYIRAVQGNAGPPGTGCDAPSNVSWLSATPSTGTINGVGSKDVTVKANAAGLALGTYNAILCVNTNDAAHPRFEIPVAFTVTPSIALDRIFKDGFDGAASSGPGMYTDRATFVSHVAAGFYENPFNDAVSGPSPPLSYTQGGIAYTVSSSIPDGDTGGGLYNDTGVISTNGSGAAVVVTFTGTPVTAVGGNFWATDVNVTPNGLDVVITLSDGTTHTFTSTGPSDFRGFTTAAPITTITIDAPNPSVPTDGSWATVDNLIVGSGN